MSTRLRIRTAAGLLAAALVLTGCTAPNGPVSRSTDDPSAPGRPPTAAGTVDADDLAQRKAEAGIEACPSSDPEIAPLPDGLPDITLPCLGGGEPVRLAGLRGTPMVINIWAQWCPPCRAEAPHLAEVSQAMAGKVDFLGVDYSDARADWAIDFAGEVGWSYPQVADETMELQAPIGIPGPPVTVFVTAEGQIAYRHPGPFTSSEQLTSLIEEHLGVR